MIKKDVADSEDSQYWICDFCVNGDVKVRDHCHIVRKYRGSTLKRL